MKKDLIVALCSCFVLVGINLSIQAQTGDQAELNGPVRRVRVETVDILVKNGNLVEGPRVLREIATYDQKGIKIDSVSHAREQTTPLGKQQYRHDDKGNIVEMMLIGEDGSILGKELYKYEFDELGNWKRKISAIAVYESGTVRYEPTEITYRTITYYYAQAVDKLASAVTKAHASDSFVPTISASRVPPTSTMPSSDTTTTTDSANSTGDEGARSIDSKVTNAGTNGLAAPVVTKQEDQRVGDYGMAVKSEARTPTSPANNALASVEKPTLKHVSEKTLRDAAINLPPPDYTPDASRERTARKVEVQIVVDEEGLVGSAQVISGNSAWNDAAERAARKARFLPAKLSSDPTKVSGIISYDFAAPASTTPSVPSSTAVEVSTSKPLTDNKYAKSDENPSAVRSSEPSPTLQLTARTTDSLSPSVASLYEKGVKYLDAGRYSEAVQALKQSLRLNPDDAISYVKLGMAHTALAQYKEAVDVLKVAIRIQPEVVDGLGFYHLGYAYSALEKPAEALDAFRRALYITRAEAADPTNVKGTRAVSIVDLHYNLGLAYHKLKRYDSAIKEWQETIKLNPKAAEAFYGLGMAYLARNNTISARNQEATLRSLNPVLANQLKDAISSAEANPPCRTLDCALGRQN